MTKFFFHCTFQAWNLPSCIAFLEQFLIWCVHDLHMAFGQKRLVFRGRWSEHMSWRRKIWQTPSLFFKRKALVCHVVISVNSSLDHSVICKVWCSFSENSNFTHFSWFKKCSIIFILLLSRTLPKYASKTFQTYLTLQPVRSNTSV